MSLSVGIVGLPNVGKSTLFNALIKKAQAEASNYPFTTIEPNVGIVGVPDPRLEKLAAIAKPEKVIPATVEFVDIAGLVAGAHQGEGLGNQFLAHIREVDAIALVVRCFENADVSHVAGKLNPVSDIQTILLELILADSATLEKILARERKLAKSDAEAAARVELLERIAGAFDREHPASSVGFSADERQTLGKLPLTTLKPFLLVANVSESEVAHPAKSALYQQVEAEAESRGVPIVAVSAKIEAEIAALPEEEQAEFLESVGLTEPNLDRFIRAGYAALNLHTFFTVGPKEVRAWTIPTTATAPEAAGAIHGDFQEKFIRADTVAYDDFVSLGGEKGATEAGKMRSEGKGYRVADGDILHIKHGA